MKLAVLVGLLSFLAATFSHASTLGPLNLQRLDAQAPFVVLGTVEKVEGSQIATIKVSSYLRGSSKKDSFELVLHVGKGMKDFDFLLKPGDKGVFFLRSIEGKHASLAMHRSMAIFKDNPFE